MFYYVFTYSLSNIHNIDIHIYFNSLFYNTLDRQNNYILRNMFCSIYILYSIISTMLPIQNNKREKKRYMKKIIKNQEISESLHVEPFHLIALFSSTEYTSKRRLLQN